MKRNKHNLSHHHLLTGDMGMLMPVGLTEVLPGDIFNHKAQAFARLSPMAAPVMHPMTIRIHHFFVPHRLSWPDESDADKAAHGTFEDFMTGGEDNDWHQNYTFPTLQLRDEPNTLMDYYGINPVDGSSNDLRVSSLPVRGYNRIFNEWYRDQDLRAVRGLNTDTPTNIAWEKDYHTTARPWPQKGDEVTLPLGSQAPVKGIGKVNQTWSGASQTVFESDGTSRTYDDHSLMDDQPNREFAVEEDPDNAGYPNIFADLSQATANTINNIRKAFALQRFSEARARFGSRYDEYLRHWGVRPLDARLQRTEYLGGSTSQVSISEVLQTAPDDQADPRFGVGDLFGHGVGVNRGSGYRRMFSEHGYVHSLLSIRPKQMFTQGIDRTWLRRDKEDFYTPELAFVGQQEVLEAELYVDDTTPNFESVFGWSDRYEEYRYARSYVSNEFRSLLDYWHLGRQFEAPPTLSTTFITCDPSKRIFNEQTQHSLWIAVQHSLVARRKVTRNATPRVF